MVATYNTELTTDRDKVRLECGDVKDFQLEDSEVDYKLGEAGGNVLLAAAACCRVLASRHAGEVDRTIGAGGMNVREGDRYKHYLEMAEKLESRAQIGAAAVFFGGSGADRGRVVEPLFTIDRSGVV